MAVASQILKNFSLFVNGKGYAGQAEEIKTPTLNLKGEEYRAGGMDAPVFVELGQEKLEASFILTGYFPEVLSLWGVGPQAVIQFVARGAVESLDGTVQPVNVTMNGLIRQIEPAAWKAGEKSALTFSLELQSYTYTQNGTVVHDIDILNFKRVVNGVDRLASQRTAIGL